MLPIMQIGITLAAVRTLTAPTTAYANSGGTGARTGSITASSNVTWGTSSTPPALVDGSFGQNSTNSLNLNVGSIAANSYIRFAFGAGVKKYIDEAKLYCHIVPSNGSWKFQASNDASAWTDLVTFTWDQQTQTVTMTGLDAAGYRYYQMICPAGHAMSNAWFEEIEFKIADGAV